MLPARKGSPSIFMVQMKQATKLPSLTSSILTQNHQQRGSRTRLATPPPFCNPEVDPTVDNLRSGYGDTREGVKIPRRTRYWSCRCHCHCSCHCSCHWPCHCSLPTAHHPGVQMKQTSTAAGTGPSAHDLSVPPPALNNGTPASYALQPPYSSGSLPFCSFSLSPIVVWVCLVLPKGPLPIYRA